MEEDYFDEDEEDINNNISIAVKENKDTDNISTHVTDTRSYDPMKFIVISPEDVMKNSNSRLDDNPNPEFAKILQDIEKSRSRKITTDEYLKACDIYAEILAERDEEKKKNYEGKYQINPIKKEQYLRLLLEKKPVTTAMQESMKEYENDMIRSVEEAYTEARKNEAKVLEIKGNDRVNLRYKGKCRIASDEGGKVIIIDNKRDVDLLRMKYRKEWIERKYKDELNTSGLKAVEENDGYE